MKKVIICISLTVSMFILSTKVYAYKSYKIGDIVTYNDIEFYVIKDSDSDYITLLKKEPLTVDEVNRYGGVGTDNNKVHNYVPTSSPYYQTAKNYIGFGAMLYYNSLDCGYYNGSWIDDGCTNQYNKSNVKFVVDAWSNDTIGKYLIEARLLNDSDLVDSFGYYYLSQSHVPYISHDDVPLIIKEYYSYWVTHEDLSSWTYYMYYGTITIASFLPINITGGPTNDNGITDMFYGLVRPVIKIYKCALENSCDNNDGDIINDTVDNKNSDKKESITKVNTSNTLKKVSGLVILIGMVLVCVGLNIFIIIKNKDRKKD